MAKKSSAHTLEYILLGLIREEPSHGYALFENLRNTPELSLIWQVKRSKLYYLLDKLENAGYLDSTTSSQGPYPERHVYQITTQGEEVLEVWLHTPVKSSRYVRLAFMSKLFFLIRDDKKGAVDLILSQVELCQGWLDNLQKQHQALGVGEFINSQVLLFRIGQITAMLNWLKNCHDTLPEIA
ncbi:MAG: PadR family transcriptional regulator [Anaerolineales bacterium]|nr:PadR family transcriptional regulator [Anaerolineales bacterium]